MRVAKIALVGDVALEIIAPYFKQAGFSVYYPSGFGAWKQEILDPESKLKKFKPDLIFDVTAHDEYLKEECENFFDERLKSLASFPYSLDGIKALISEARFALMSESKKVLAVDADNTLWKGILSEDGRAALRAQRIFQEGLLELKAKGVILVLLTKNDPANSFIREDMPLSDRDFAVRKINWSPKAGNLIEACRELNVDESAVVFLDDNPFERSEMSAHLPNVTVAPWEGWGEGTSEKEEGQLIRRLTQYFFANFGRTTEDLLRARDYASPARQIRNQFASVDAYLTELDLRVEPRAAELSDVQRLAQMAGKTNQFNATTIRRKEEDFISLINDNTKRVFVFKTRDRFGEQGIVAYVIADISSRHVTDFVMSCRIMGRTLEFFIWQFICRELGFSPIIDFVPTAKNFPFKEFLNNGFAKKTFYNAIILAR